MEKIFKKTLVIFILINLLIFNISLVFANSDDDIELVSESAILMDTKTGKILYGKNENKKMYPASTTKIMTALLTLENCNLDETVNVSYDAVISIPEGYSTAYLQIGETLTIEQLLNLLLIHSANDAANVLAEHVGGSIESFVSMMNTRINELGLKNTHFTNTYGKHDDDHYTTATDLANLMKYCIKNENFRTIAGKASCSIPATNLYGPRKYNSTNELIIPTNKNYYENITCGKTGYTTQAGDCLVSCAYKDDLELICVILGGKTVNNISTRFSETKKLYEYAYSNYQIKNIINENDVVEQIKISNGTKDTKNLDIITKSSVPALLKNDISIENTEPKVDLKEKISAPIEEGEILGTITYEIDEITYKTDLIASHSVQKSKLVPIIIQIVIVTIILLIIYKILIKKRHKKNKYKIYRIQKGR